MREREGQRDQIGSALPLAGALCFGPERRSERLADGATWPMVADRRVHLKFSPFWQVCATREGARAAKERRQVDSLARLLMALLLHRAVATALIGVHHSMREAHQRHLPQAAHLCYITPPSPPHAAYASRQCDAVEGTRGRANRLFALELRPPAGAAAQHGGLSRASRRRQVVGQVTQRALPRLSSLWPAPAPRGRCSFWMENLARCWRSYKLAPAKGLASPNVKVKRAVCVCVCVSLYSQCVELADHRKLVKAQRDCKNHKGIRDAE